MPSVSILAQTFEALIRCTVIHPVLSQSNVAPQQQLHKEMSKIDRERSQQKADSMCSSSIVDIMYAHCLKEVDNKMTSDAMESGITLTSIRPVSMP